MISRLRARGLRLGVVSNCYSEDVVAWPRCPLAPQIDCTVWSFEVGLAKPDPEIYLEATRRLGVGVDDTWYVGDGTDEELPGAERVGLRAFRALWYPKRWPHFQEVPSPHTSLTNVEELVSVVEQSHRAAQRRDEADKARAV